MAFLPAGSANDLAETKTRGIAGQPAPDSTRATIYVYGLSVMSFEQINNSTGAVTYLHHNQQGSTRLLTGSTGKTEGSYSYSAYGTPEHTGTATTPLGYDGQYTSSGTGLIYLRAREYDPATAQFLSVDPLEALTGEPYAYANDNPLNEADPTGLGFFGELEELGEEVGEGVAGWGDKLTFGGTEWVREQLGDNNINTCSAGYQAGGYAGLVTGALIPGEDISTGLRFTEDQDALIQLAKEAARSDGLTPEDTEALKEGAEEYGVNFRGSEIHPNRNFNIYHVHVGPVPHIPTSIGPVQP